MSAMIHTVRNFPLSHFLSEKKTLLETEILHIFSQISNDQLETYLMGGNISVEGDGGGPLSRPILGDISESCAALILAQLNPPEIANWLGYDRTMLTIDQLCTGDMVREEHSSIPSQTWWLEVDGELEYQFPAGTYSLFLDSAREILEEIRSLGLQLRAHPWMGHKTGPIPVNNFRRSACPISMSFRQSRELGSLPWRRFVVGNTMH
ncbi:hypothetical protein F3Y22_tig00014370pilonHSYRG00123 [Hibiscus syriacus]|uniref:Uncharacterized protein n=1 Tax=Hibiscus syriacus TaxID=106335 RepID=A0A6A3BZN0_HIBSY|nr:hypothetical protein F3Y22_tig00014370pilonHSYRG00123 [Hibiscus syriacus]